MNHKHFRLVKTMVIISAWGLMMAACQEDLSPTKLTVEQQATLVASDHAQMMMATQEALDVTAGAMETKGVSSGRVAQGGGHDDYGCAPSVNLTLNIDRNHADSIIYQGTIVINYGDGSSCDKEKKRTGKITDEFSIIVSTKNPLVFSSTETLTFDAFTRDSTTYNGSISVSSANGRRTKVEGKNVAIHYADGTVSAWNGLLNFAYEDVSKRKGEIRVTGSITGTSRQGIGYTATITEDVIFKTGCFGWVRKIPVDGVVTLTTNGTTSVLDYGDGTCDKTYTITVNGETTTETFR